MIRAAALGLIAAILFGVLVFRLWALQVLHSDHYVAQANQNDVRELALPAPRGEIVDRTGTVLVKNTSHVLAEVNPAGLAGTVSCSSFPLGQQATCASVLHDTPVGAVPRCVALPGQARCIELAKLGKVLGLKRRDIWSTYERTLFVNPDGTGGCTPKTDHLCYVVNAGAPIPIKSATEPQVAYVLERRGDFHGVQFLQTTQRQYPFHDLAANILGYVSQISQSELKDSNFHGLTDGAEVGQAGVEYSYDSKLRGVDGVSQQNYDAAGRAVGQAYVQQAAQPGDTLQLSIDYRLQKVAQRAIAYGIQVAHSDGETTAHSRRDRGHEPAERRDLRDGLLSQLRPVRVPAARQGRRQAVQGQVQPAAGRQDAGPKAPGSTFKPITATAAWNSGIIGSGTHLDCSGVFYRPGDTSHTPFHQLDDGVARLDQPVDRAGGSPATPSSTGSGTSSMTCPTSGIASKRRSASSGSARAPPLDIPVPPYFSGLVPDPAWRLQTYSNPIDQIWQPGYDIQMAIGQGDLTVSPLQLAIAYSASQTAATWSRRTWARRCIDPAAT